MRWWQRLPFPAVAPAIDVPRPPEYGGLLTIFPIVSKRHQYAGFNSLRTDWFQTIAGSQNVGDPSFLGDVYSIQLTARPGYYVAPEILYQIGWSGLPADQEGPFG